MHCSKSAQPVPKAAYHNRPRCDSNLGPLTPQSDALTTRRLRPYYFMYHINALRKLFADFACHKLLIFEY